jgi:hypothetical protein
MNNNGQQRRRRGQRVRDVQLPVLVTEPLQMLASSNAISLSWEYLNTSEADRVLDESSVRLRLAFEGDGVSLSEASAAASATPNASVGLHAEYRLKEFSKGLLQDYVFQSDATLGASGAFVSDATVFGIRDDEKVEFREYVNLQKGASASLSSSLSDSFSNFSSSDSGFLSDIAQARFALSLHQLVARAYAFPVYCSMTSIASRITSGVSRPVDTARSIGLISPTGSIVVEEKADFFHQNNIINTGKSDVNDEDYDDIVSVSVEPDRLSIELQQALMTEEALGKATPEMLRQVRVQYVEAAYDIEEEVIKMASRKGQGRGRSKFSNQSNQRRYSQNTKLVDAAKSRGIDMSSFVKVQEDMLPPRRSSFTVELDPTRRQEQIDFEDDAHPSVNTMENVRLLDPPGRTLRPYLTQSRVLPFFIERPVALPSLLRRVGIPASSLSIHTSHSVVDLSSNRLWPDECSVCGCVREEIGVYASFLKVHEGTEHEALVCDDVCKKEALNKEAANDVKKRKQVQKEGTKIMPSMSRKGQADINSILLRVKRHTQAVSKPNLFTSNPIFSFFISIGKRAVTLFFWPFKSLWISSLGVVLLRFPAFLLFEISVAWICTAICVGISLGLGRAFLSSLCIPLHIQHDATGFVLGGYAFLLLLDYAVICKYTLSSAIGGFVRRYAMAVARAASQLEDSLSHSATRKSDSKSQSKHNITNTKSSVNNISSNANTASRKSNPLIEEVALIRVPQSISARFKSHNDSNSRNSCNNHNKKVVEEEEKEMDSVQKSVDLFDLAILSCDNGQLADNCKDLSGRIKLALLKWFIRYIGLPIWRNSVKEKLHIGNVHSTPREMNLTRIFSLLKAAFVHAFVTALWVGIAWASVADPVSLTTLLFEFLKRVFGVDVMSYEPIRVFFLSALDPQWRLAGPLSSFFSMMLVGVYVLSVTFETFVSGSLGETYKGWAELYEWRLISVHSTRFWARKLAPTLSYCMKSSIGGYVTSFVAVCCTAFLATEKSLGFCAINNNKTNNSLSSATTGGAWIPSLCTVEGAQVFARMSVVFFALARLGIYLWSRRQMQDSIVMRVRVWLLSWSEKLRRQRYSIDKALLNFKRRSHPSSI